MISTTSDIPEFTLVAGPNGSGKSTAVDQYVKQRFADRPYLCADNVLRDWMQADGPLASDRMPEIQAAEFVDAEVDTHIAARTPFVVETVMSSPKYRQSIERGRCNGMLFWLVYVTTMDPFINVARVAQRVLRGGHDVPEGKIIDRWGRSMAALPWFVERADKLLIVDNSLDAAVPLALRRYRQGVEIVSADRSHPALARIAHLEGVRAIQP